MNQAKRSSKKANWIMAKARILVQSGQPGTTLSFCMSSFDRFRYVEASVVGVADVGGMKTRPCSGYITIALDQ